MAPSRRPHSSSSSVSAISAINGREEDDGSGVAKMESKPPNGTQHQEQQPASLQNGPPPGESSAEVVSTVCCGCRPKSRRYEKFDNFTESIHRAFRRRRRHDSDNYDINNETRQQQQEGQGQRDRTDSMASTRSLFSTWNRRRRYFDANMGDDAHWNKVMQEQQMNDDSIGADSLYFFDALEHPLGDEEYPIDGYVIKSDLLGDYPIVFTTSVQHPAPHVSMDHPETLLKRRRTTPPLPVSTTPHGGRSHRLTSESIWLASTDQNDDPGGGTGSDMATSSRQQQRKATTTATKRKQQYHQEQKHKRHPTKAERRHSEPIESHKEPSMRFLNILRRPTLEHAQQLQEPRVKVSLKGYPGELDVMELEECVRVVATAAVYFSVAVWFCLV